MRGLITDLGHQTSIYNVNKTPQRGNKKQGESGRK